MDAQNDSENTFRSSSPEQLAHRVIVCAVLSALSVLGFVVLQFFVTNYIPAQEKIMLCVYAGIGYWLYTAFYLGVSYNFKKFLLGLVAPIPIVSYIIEGFHCYVIGFKGLHFLVKSR